jgi:nitrite reductase/ring-hydroxylating ferredoxin subunit
MVPLWHAGFHRPWHQDRADDLGQLDAAQVQDRRIGLPAQLRRSDDQGLRRDLRGLGYELHVGGNGGIHLRGTDLLCKVTTEQEALDVCAAFIQLYREQAWYLERTAPWIERVGLEREGATVRRSEAVATLAARFRYSQQFMQDDPGRAAPPARMPICTSRFRRCPLRSGDQMMTTWLDVAATGDRTRQCPHPARAGRRGNRHLPHDGRVLCAGQQVPAQARPAFAGIVHGDVVTCPLHSWNISLKTGEAQGDDKGCVPTIPLKIDAGRICLIPPLCWPPARRNAA